MLCSYSANRTLSLTLAFSLLLFSLADTWIDLFALFHWLILRFLLRTSVSCLRTFVYSSFSTSGVVF